MTISAGEAKWMKAAEVSDAATNGGRMSINEAVSAIAEAVFPNIPVSERTAGSTKYRKLFLKIASAADETLSNALAFLHRPTPGDDIMTIFLGDQTNQQGDIGGEDHYGAGQLDSAIIAGATSCDVLVEDAALDTIFRIGDTVRISDEVVPGDGGNVEYRVLDSVSFVGNVATLGWTDALTNGYSDTDTWVSSGLDLGDIVGTYDGFTVTTAGDGDFDDTTYPILVDSVAGIEDDWTITFTSSTAFTVAGAVTGALAAGSILAAYAPNNPDFGEPFFTINNSGFSGTWANGDTIEFSTHPAAAPVWYKRTVPAGAAALSTDKCLTVLNGENV